MTDPHPVDQLASSTSSTSGDGIFRFRVDRAKVDAFPSAYLPLATIGRPEHAEGRQVSSRRALWWPWVLFFALTAVVLGIGLALDAPDAPLSEIDGTVIVEYGQFCLQALRENLYLELAQGPDAAPLAGRIAAALGAGARRVASAAHSGPDAELGLDADGDLR
jgi:hypothetical protein